MPIGNKSKAIEVFYAVCVVGVGFFITIARTTKIGSPDRRSIVCRAF